MSNQKNSLYFNYDLNEYSSYGIERDQIPLGQYVFKCKSVELKNYENNNPITKINLGWQCISDCPSKGIVTFTSHTIICPHSPEAEQIGRGQLKGIAEVMRRLPLLLERKTYEILLDGIVGGVVKVEQEGTQYEKNKIALFKDRAKVDMSKNSFIDSRENGLRAENIPTNKSPDPFDDPIPEFF